MMRPAAAALVALVAALSWAADAAADSKVLLRDVQVRQEDVISPR